MCQKDSCSLKGPMWSFRLFASLQVSLCLGALGPQPQILHLRPTVDTKSLKVVCSGGAPNI